MPKKSRISTVPVDEPVVAEAEEPKTEAQEMTEVINTINEEPAVAPEVVADVAKPKKKTSRAKSKAREPVVNEPEDVPPSNPPSSGEEPVPDDAPSSMLHPGVAVRAAVVCEHCGKSMTAKTFKYSHKYTCKSKPKDEPQPNSLLAQEAAKVEELLYQAKCNRMANAREAKARLKEERLSKLVVDAF